MKTIALILLVSAGVCVAQPDPESPIEELREQYREELIEASRIASEAYIKRLHKLKKQLIKRDRLKEAIAVGDEIKSIKVRVNHADIFAALKGTWTFTTTGNSFHIGMDGAVEGGKKGARVVIADPARRIVRLSAHLFRLSDDGMQLTGKGLEGGSKHTARKRP